MEVMTTTEAQNKVLTLMYQGGWVMWAFGLIVAVPAQLAYSSLAGRVERITDDIEAVASFLLETREEVRA